MCNKKIIIIDDDDDNILLLEYIIEEVGYKCISFENAKDGIEYLNNNPNEKIILLLDIRLPYINGLDAIKIIREKHKEITIISMSASDISEYHEKALSFGANYFMSKPIKAKKLIKLIQEN